MAAWYLSCMTKYCENPECGEEFDPTEHDEEFCSPGCEDRVRELEDED